ncbi:SGNH hydrolase-type esterase domain protein [Vibrio phage 1.076.O._10N.286.51.B7]|nr:SGNH hydrolase-type esterase domain protein [Vibrio phage 1.076.O._10N.286.51.B7]
MAYPTKIYNHHRIHLSTGHRPFLGRAQTVSEPPTDEQDPIMSAALNIGIIGASLMQGAFQSSGRTQVIEQMLEDAGYRAKVMGYAVGGNKISSVRGQLPEAFTEIDSRGGYKLIAGHGGGNDVSSAWQGYPQDADHIKDETQGIFDDCKAANFDVMWSPISYRVPPASNPTTEYNTNDILPIIEAETPQWLTGTNWDLYDLLFNNQQTLVDDGIHPNDDGDLLIQQLFVDAVTSHLPPQNIPDTTGIKAVLIRFCPDTFKTNFMGIKRNQISFDDTFIEIYNKDLSLVADGQVKLAGDGYFDQSGLSTSRSSDLDIYNSAAVKDNVSLANPTYLEFSPECFVDGKTYTVRITGCRLTSSTDRVGKYTLGGESKTLDAALNVTGGVQQVIEFTGVSAIDMRVGILAEPDSGSIRAYYSAIEILEE